MDEITVLLLRETSAIYRLENAAVKKKNGVSMIRQFCDVNLIALTVHDGFSSGNLINSSFKVPRNQRLGDVRRRAGSSSPVSRHAKQNPSSL